MRRLHAPTELRAGVEREEHELRIAVAELGTATRRSVDPKHWIQESPFVCVAGALALGLWLGGRPHATH
jgi:hypothetical protein